MATTVTIGMVAAFQIRVDDWEQYTERLEQFFVANAIADDSKKLATFLTVIGPRTYALLSNLLAPAKPATKTYAELVTAVKDHLKPSQRDSVSTRGRKERVRLWRSTWQNSAG